MGAKQRNSSIELLKVFAVVMIVLSHAAAGALGYVEGLPSKVTTAELVNLGQIGNCLFFIASAWFLCASIKFKPEKAIKLVSESIVTSLACTAFVVLLGYQLSKGEILLSAFPITYGYNWFISCYLLVYMIHPLLNAVISNMSRQQHFNLISSMIVIYGCFVITIGGGKLYYTELLGFIMIYFITAYLKQYHHNIKIKFLLMWITLGLLLWQVSTIVISLGGKPLWLNKFVNPCFMLIAFPAFLYVVKFNFTNRFINWLSSLSLMIYMLHNNKLVREILEVDFFLKQSKISSNGEIFITVLLWFIITLLLSIIVGALFQKIFSLSCFGRLYNYVSNCANIALFKIYKKTI